VKTYTELLADEAYLSLGAAPRAILHSLWLAYAQSRCRLSADTGQLSRRLNLRVRQSDLEALNRAGFIDFVASASLADGYHAASASRAREEEEKEKEKDSPLPPQSGGTSSRENGLNPRALGENPRALAKTTLPERRARKWIDNGLADLIPDAHLEEVLADEFDIGERELAAELATYARERRA
jgi:hypothetical protein